MSNSTIFEQAAINHPSYSDSSERVSKDGYAFNINSNTWVLNKDVRITFMSEILSMEPSLLSGFKKTLAIYAEEQSADHTSNMYLRFQRFLRDTKFKVLNEHAILNWRGMLDKENEWYLGSLRGFLISWNEYGYYGVTADTVRLLETLTLSGNKKGVAVANRCPYSGAFTRNEMLALNHELIRLFTKNSISFACYAYVSVLQATARRPVQLRQLRSIDLQKQYNKETGATNFYLNTPRSKQRGVGFREHFKKLAITEDLYLILVNLVDEETKKLSTLFGVTLTVEQKSQVPMFIDWDVAENSAQENRPFNKDLLDSDLLHISATDLMNVLLKDFQRKQNAISERTGDYIHITARRFRHTRGTNLGRKGLGALIIAEALDHNDTQNVIVYTENTADTATYINKIVGKQLAPLANTFLGRIIETVEEGERGADLTARIPNRDNEVVGTCGTNDFCSKGYESCYICEKFRPLLDAPHEKFLEGLYAEKEARLKSTKSVEYAATKDRLILAVEWVVQRCDEIKKGKNGGVISGQ